MERLYQELKGKLRAEQMTTKMLARKLGISESHLSNVLNGRSSPRMDIAYEILGYLGVPLEDLPYYFPPNGTRLEKPEQRRTIDLPKQQVFKVSGEIRLTLQPTQDGDRTINLEMLR